MERNRPGRGLGARGAHFKLFQAILVWDLFNIKLCNAELLHLHYQNFHLR
jgi:hypothetical protein